MGCAATPDIFSGQYSRKAFERLGFSVAAEINYSEYEPPGSNGDEASKIFKGIGNHRCVTLLTKRLFAKQESIDEEAMAHLDITGKEGESNGK